MTPRRAARVTQSHRVGPHGRSQVVGDADVRRIHETTLDVLATVGVHVPLAARARRARGARRDGRPRDRPSRSCRPSSSRAPSPRMPPNVHARRPRPGVRPAARRRARLPVRRRLRRLRARGRRLGAPVGQGRRRATPRASPHGLDNVSTTSAIVSAQDCPEESRVLHEFDACVRGSSKHAIVVSIKDDGRGAQPDPHGRGGRRRQRRAARARPLFTCILCTVSPLHQEHVGMDLAFTLAEAGIPFMLYPMPILGATAPVTPAGTAVVNNTEIVAAVAAVQLAVPGRAHHPRRRAHRARHAHRRRTSPPSPSRCCCASCRRRWRPSTGCPPASATAAPRPRRPTPKPAGRTRFTMATRVPRRRRLHLRQRACSTARRSTPSSSS